MTRRFSTGAILSCTTGKLLCEGGISEVHELMEELLGRPIWTHQMPAAAPRIRQLALEAWPWAAAISADEVTPANWRSWLAQQIMQYGPYHQRTKTPEKGESCE